MQQEKIYVGNGKEINTQYGPLLKLSFSAQELQQMLSMVNEKGYPVLVDFGFVGFCFASTECAALSFFLAPFGLDGFAPVDDVTFSFLAALGFDDTVSFP